MWRCTFLAFLFLSIPALVQAEEPLYRLDTVNVTATRTARTADETLASVTVIDRTEIERVQARSVEELLHSVPGVSVATNGGAGKFTAAYLRGTEADHVLVLVDGIKVGSATTGMAAFQDIPVEAIDRIEVVRGPCSSLYGSEAIGGVIQIFTRTGRGPVAPDLAGGGGAFGTYDGAVGLSGGGDHSSYAATVSRFRTEGFSARPVTPGAPPDEPDKDGYRNTSVSARMGWRRDQGTEAGINYLHAEGKTFYDGSFVNESEFSQEVLGGRLHATPFGWYRFTTILGRSEDRSSNSKDGDFRTRFDTRRYSAALQNDINLPDGSLLTVGADWLEDRIRSTTTYTATTRDTRGLFGQYQGAIGQNQIRVSLRRDAIREYTGRTTGSAAWGRRLGKVASILASYGTAFKTPTFNELFYPGFGNPALRPEASRSLEVGVSRVGVLGRASLSAFETRVDELITYDAASQMAKNLDRARIRGLESQLALYRRPWEARVSLTLLDPRNRASTTGAGSTLPYRARRSGRVDVDYSRTQFGLGATLQGEGRRYDDLANSTVMPAYATLDLRLEYAPASWCRAQLRMENVVDARYETVATYDQPGRAIFLTLRVHPQRTAS
jgi:vitamin B12 transporter